MRALVLLADRAERSQAWRETRLAVADAAYWAWLVALVAAVTVWVGRGMPDPRSAAVAGGAMLAGAAGAAWRASRRVRGAEDRGAAALRAARVWLTVYGAAAALIPAAVAVGQDDQRAALLPLAVLAAALFALAVLTVPVRARWRLLRRLRNGAAAVAGDDDVRVGRALWTGWTARLDRVHISYPQEWAAHRESRRDDLVERVVFDLVGPPPRTPAEARQRPDYLTTFNHQLARLEVARVPSLPRRLTARDWGELDGLVLGQTTADLADAVVDGRPVALYRPAGHLLIVGATQHGKSSGARAWAVHGLTNGLFPGGLWAVDGKGSGSFAPLADREGVHAIAHSPDEWRQVITTMVAPEVARRYEAALAWRAGRSDRRPWLPLGLLVIDEIQQVLAACPDLAGPLDTLARQALEARVIIWVLTQRPDARDAVPGAMRDQLVDRVTFGPLSGAGAKMTFDMSGDWHRGMGVAPIPGRALTWMGGLWRPVQAPWLPFPADVPDVEPLYPPRAAQRATQRPRPTPRQSGPRGEAEARPGHPRPAPRPPDPEPVPEPRAPDPLPPVPQVPEVVDEILRDFGDEPGDEPEGGQGTAGGTAAYDPSDPYAHRRRRRRRD
ncbi:hypothetical protein ACQP1W_52465 (plasmid) [Spirillospora sp. CA-255316]